VPGVAVPSGENERMSDVPKRTGSPESRPCSGGRAGVPGLMLTLTPGAPPAERARDAAVLAVRDVRRAHAVAVAALVDGVPWGASWD